MWETEDHRVGLVQWHSELSHCLQLQYPVLNCQFEPQMLHYQSSSPVMNLRKQCQMAQALGLL